LRQLCDWSHAANSAADNCTHVNAQRPVVVQRAGGVHQYGAGVVDQQLSTNLAENSMRPIAIGRKNWIHLGSQEAGPKVAAIFSIVESCRRLGLPIREYLADILPRLANRSIQSLAQLTPAARAARKKQ
jgi:hypothetical protein